MKLGPFLLAQSCSIQNDFDDYKMFWGHVLFAYLFADFETISRGKTGTPPIPRVWCCCLIKRRLQNGHCWGCVCGCRIGDLEFAITQQWMQLNLVLIGDLEIAVTQKWMQLNLVAWILPASENLEFQSDEWGQELCHIGQHMLEVEFMILLDIFSVHLFHFIFLF